MANLSRISSWYESQTLKSQSLMALSFQNNKTHTSHKLKQTEPKSKGGCLRKIAGIEDAGNQRDRLNCWVIVVVREVMKGWTEMVVVN